MPAGNVCMPRTVACISVFVFVEKTVELLEHSSAASLNRILVYVITMYFTSDGYDGVHNMSDRCLARL